MRADPFLTGFTLHDIDAAGIRIRAAVGGEGPPVLLLHGHPQTHATWHAVAPRLALWGGTVGRTCDVRETWREKARDVRGHALDCGHALQEERPEEVSAALLAFLA